MRLKNKRTGEIVDTLCRDDITKGLAFGIDHHDGNPTMAYYNSLAELNAEWEDVPEESEEYWYVSCDGRVLKATTDQDEYNEKHNSGHVSIGNYFETKEEAEKAVEKLKAWKRLKEKGFRFYGDIKYECLCGNGFGIPLRAEMPPEAYTDIEVSKDLDICFGGEE